MRQVNRYYPGLKIAMLTFIQKTEQKKGHSYIWALLCDCGNTTFSIASKVGGGTKKSCGCLRFGPREKIKDWTGKKINKLTFIRPLKERQQGAILWELLCDCGNIFICKPAKVANGHTSSCGCYKRQLVLDAHQELVGKKYGMLTFVKTTGEKKEKSYIWELLCDCGSIYYNTSISIVRGNTTSCGCFGKQQRKIGAYKNRKYTPRISSAVAIWRRSYKECSFEIFYELSQKNCYYCDREPYRIWNIGTSNNNRGTKDQINDGDFIYNGLDRVDSALGHTPDNVVPCCYECNTAKSALSLDAFLELIRRIFHNRCK